MINVCVPVLNRYDMLREMLLSLRVSTVPPNAVYVINNGRDQERVEVAIADTIEGVIILRPNRALGVAESWNWFINNVPEERIITNDDTTFSPESLAQMAGTEGDFIVAQGFSCFLVRDRCINEVGLFDETISPGYGYFEDIDYSHRMQLNRSIKRVNQPCGVDHKGSQTPRAYSESDWRAHHQKFMIAQNNYVQKWGAHPEWERLKAADGMSEVGKV